MQWHLPIRLLGTCVLVCFALQVCHATTDGNAAQHRYRSGGTRITHPEVEAVLGRLSLIQKIGQITQFDIQMALHDKVLGRLEVNADHLASIFHHIGPGSFFNTPMVLGPWAANQSNIDPMQWRDIMDHIQQIAAQYGPKIPPIMGIDSVHGAAYIEGAAVFPHQIGLAASFDRKQVRKMAQTTAKDMRQVGLHWNFAPILDVAVNPMWPRIYETFGECPHLVAELGVEAIRGMQGHNIDLSTHTRVAATFKHFIGYSAPIDGKDRSATWIPDRELLDYFAKPFAAAIDAGAATGMESFNEINGVPVCCSTKYLQNLLRDRLGFEGVLVTDYMEVYNLHSWHKVARNLSHSVEMALKQTSIDMVMVPVDIYFKDYVEGLVKAGKLSIARLDESVRRVLTLKHDLGLFGAHAPPASVGRGWDPAVPLSVGDSEDYKAALIAAQSSIVLLQNNANLLPISHEKGYRRVLIVGPWADSMKLQSGGWTVHWQGANKESDFVNFHGSTLFQSLNRSIYNNAKGRGGEGGVGTGPTSVTYFACIDEHGNEVDSDGYDRAMSMANDMDLIIVTIGEPVYTEKPGDIGDLRYPANVMDFALQFSGMEPPTVLVLVQGRPRLVENLPRKVDAILWAPLPGPEGGQAVSDVINGIVNPSGRLPISWPRGNGMFIPYWHKHSQSSWYYPQWEFGHGLSYSTYRYTDLIVSSNTVGQRGNITVEVQLSNEGPMDGSHSVLLYLKQHYRSVTPEEKMLKAFDKVYLQAGASKTVAFMLGRSAFCFMNQDLDDVVEGGEFTIFVGDLNHTISVADGYDGDNDGDNGDGHDFRVDRSQDTSASSTTSMGTKGKM